MFWRRLARGALATTLDATGARAAIAGARRVAAGGRRVLVFGYHRVVRDFEGERPRAIESCMISREAFRTHVRFLAERFELATMTRAVEVLDGRATARRDLAVLTFDDGYRDVLDNALPVLREFRAAATIYVSSGIVAKGGHFPHDRLFTLLRAWEANEMLRVRVDGKARALVEDAMQQSPGGPQRWLYHLIRHHDAEALGRVSDALAEVAPAAIPPESAAALDWDGVRALAASGLEIGAHTVGHCVLTHYGRETIEREIAACQDAIEREVRRPVRHFAYCNGYYNDAVVKALRARSFLSGVTTEDRLNRRGDDPFRIARRVLWEGSGRGAFGTSPALVACVLDDAWSALGFDASEPGERPTVEEEAPTDVRRFA